MPILKKEQNQNLFRTVKKIDKLATKFGTITENMYLLIKKKGPKDFLIEQNPVKLFCSNLQNLLLTYGSR